MGNTRAIGTAYRDQDLDGSTITNSQFSGTLNTFGGKVWYCDSSGPGYNGSSWAQAFNTVGAALAHAASGDIVAIRGSFNEVATMSAPGVTIVGVGTGPKQAQWSSATDTASLTIAANYCSVQNVYFKPPAFTSVTTFGPSSILLNGANWATIIGNRFQGQTGSYEAIYSPVCNSDNVTIQGNAFYYMNTLTNGAAILGVEAGGLSYSGWQITDNVFSSCVTGINVNCRAAIITGNTVMEYGITALGAVGAVLALGLDLSGTGSGANGVWGNQLGGTYSATLYKVGASGDQWGGNYNVIAGGVTAANPS